jgi:hypothetical protein
VKNIHIQGEGKKYTADHVGPYALSEVENQWKDDSRGLALSVLYCKGAFWLLWKECLCEWEV